MSAPTLKRSGSSLSRDISPPATKKKIIATTTANTVANFFKPASEKPLEKIAFSVLDESLLIARYPNERPATPSPPLKIAAFDFDGTIISTKSGNRFSKGPNDWQWWDPAVPGTLKQLHQEGFQLVIISNQAAVSLKHDSKTPKSGMLSLNNFKSKTTAVLSALDLPIMLFAATQHDHFRKPRTGMWRKICKEFNVHSETGFDHKESFFVGDAAGREGDKTTGGRKDHSCSDRNFALNVQMGFLTPEEYFLGVPPQPFVQSFDPAPYIAGVNGASGPVKITNQPFARKHDVEIVLFCGSPGAGKSTFFWQHLEPLAYSRVNQDLLKTRDKCVRVATEFLIERRSVVVDNTNADLETRAVWVSLAKRLSVPIRLIHFTTPGKLCEHNDTVRALNQGVVSIRGIAAASLIADLDIQMNPEKRSMLPKMAFTGFASRFREPMLAEGFEDITQVDFQFRGNDEQKAVWGQHWIT